MSKQSMIILAFFFLVNAYAFFLMWLDKQRSRKNGTERISEGLLFFLAAAFGSAGVFAGMFTCRHKNRKWYFLVGVPLLFLQNLAFLYLVYSWII